MAKLVLGIGTSHTPMLNAPPTDWPRFIERDTQRTNLLDVDGKLTTYEAQLKRAPADIDAQIAPEKMAARHASVEAAMSRLGDYLREAKLDTLIVVGDDQDELYHPANMPGILVYYGDDHPQRAAGAGGEPDLGLARQRPLVRGKDATRLPGRRRPGSASDRSADRRRIRHRRVGFLP